jgi:hypothetical protein
MKIRQSISNLSLTTNYYNDKIITCVFPQKEITLKCDIIVCPFLWVGGGGAKAQSLQVCLAFLFPFHPMFPAFLSNASYDTLLS